MAGVDLGNTNVLVCVFAMHACPACEEFLPRFSRAVEKAGVPFHVWGPGEVISPGEIPVMFYDAGSKDDELQDFADRLGITATPTTCVMTRTGTWKVEGAMPAGDIDRLLQSAENANR